MTLIEFPLKKIPNQPPEKYYGNREYKIFLDTTRFPFNKINLFLEKKASQMLFRINEGDGKAKYIIGITDDGIAQGISYNQILKSVIILDKIINKINAQLKKLRFYKGTHGFICTAHVYKNTYDFDLVL